MELLLLQVNGRYIVIKSKLHLETEQNKHIRMASLSFNLVTLQHSLLYRTLSGTRSAASALVVTLQVFMNIWMQFGTAWRFAFYMV